MEFVLTLPSIDNITNEIIKICKGSLIYKVDISREFRHVKIDPSDYYLLGLKLDQYYLDTCLPSGFRHGSSIFQRLSDAIRFIMAFKGHRIMNYIDNLTGHGDQARHSCPSTHSSVLSMNLVSISVTKNWSLQPYMQCGLKLIQQISHCLYLLKNSQKFVVHVTERNTCSKRELQSLLGQLLYITKCVRSSMAFLNHMLTPLRESH